jgi:UDP-glucose 4-epimerase
MKILITGSSGFVGTHLTKKLSRKYEIVTYDLVSGQDVLDGKLLTQKLKGVDLVIHLAAFISATESWEKPMDYFRNNALGTLSVINSSIKMHVNKLIFFSSAAVKAKPLTPYAVSKITAEEIAKLYSDKINTVIVRPENIYGLGQKSNYGYVIHNFIKAVRNGKEIIIYGDGNQTRDFIYVDDVIKTVEKLVEIKIKSGTIISLGTGEETKIISLAKKVMKILNKKTKIEFSMVRNEPRKSVADIKTLSKLGINAKQFIGLDEGIGNLV